MRAALASAARPAFLRELGLIMHRERETVEFHRITVDPKRMGGVPCIRNLRVPVATVIDMVAEGMSEAEILRSYPDLEAADIKEALHFAAEAVRERDLPLLSG